MNCIYLGAQKAVDLECSGLPARLNVKVFDCAKHVLTTLDQLVPGHVCCSMCRDYSTDEPDPFTGPVTRHLLYHLYPLRESLHLWQKNADALRKRLGVFNGRRIISIVTNAYTSPVDEVISAFGDNRIEFLILPNDTSLREVRSWVPMWEALGASADDENAITFHGHGKGVSWSGNKVVGPCSSLWGDVMYETMLDYIPLVHRFLQRFSLIGALRRLTDCVGDTRYRWHFHGSFMWIRNKHCKVDKWGTIAHAWYGSESWPGSNYPPGDASALLINGGEEMNCYEMSYLEDVVLPALRRFRVANESMRGHA